MKKHLAAVACVVYLLCFVTPLQAQKVWEKPHQGWSFMDVMMILKRSPWAQTQHDQSKLTSATTRLHSALPVRQAMVKLQKIFQSYDKFSAADKARFDDSVKEFLDCPYCTQYYIVAVKSPHYQTVPTKLKNVFDIYATFKDSSLEELTPYVFLTNDKGEQRELARFIPPKREEEEAVALFLFPRLDDKGKPLFSTENKTFSFMIDEKLFRGKSVPVKKVSFDVSRLVRDGVIVF